MQEKWSSLCLRNKKGQRVWRFSPAHWKRKRSTFSLAQHDLYARETEQAFLWRNKKGQEVGFSSLAPMEERTLLPYALHDFDARETARALCGTLQPDSAHVLASRPAHMLMKP
jgi:hypothetical protein